MVEELLISQDGLCSTVPAILLQHAAILWSRHIYINT